MEKAKTSETIRCNVKLYDADDGIFAGYCRLAKGHKKPHAISWEFVEDKKPPAPESHKENK